MHDEIIPGGAYYLRDTIIWNPIVEVYCIPRIGKTLGPCVVPSSVCFCVPNNSCTVTPARVRQDGRRRLLEGSAVYTAGQTVV